MDDRSIPFVSVIVPVFNDVKNLKVCLEALENQTYPKDYYEVIVIDNGSENSELVFQVIKNFQQAIFTEEKIPGSYAARNKGISLAKGEIIAFTDADCIPTLNWVENGVKILLDKVDCGLVAGKIKVLFKDKSNPNAIELYESITGFDQKKYIRQGEGGVTANIFTRKSVIEKVGVFNINLKSSGDVEWGKRVFLAGYSQVYAESACVSHPARFSFKQLYKKTTRLAGGFYGVHIQPETSWLKQNMKFVWLLMSDFIPPVNFAINIFRDNRVKGVSKKIQIPLVLLIVRYISAWEKIRLRVGGMAKRA